MPVDGAFGFHDDDVVCPVPAQYASTICQHNMPAQYASIMCQYSVSSQCFSTGFKGGSGWFVRDRLSEDN